MKSTPQKCSVCFTTNNLKKCANCNTAIYCSKKCQIDDWRNHKQFCEIAAGLKRKRLFGKSEEGGEKLVRVTKTSDLKGLIKIHPKEFVQESQQEKENIFFKVFQKLSNNLEIEKYFDVELQRYDRWMIEDKDDYDFLYEHLEDELTFDTFEEVLDFFMDNARMQKTKRLIDMFRKTPYRLQVLSYGWPSLNVNAITDYYRPDYDKFDTIQMTVEERDILRDWIEGYYDTINDAAFSALNFEWAGYTRNPNMERALKLQNTILTIGSVSKNPFKVIRGVKRGDVKNGIQRIFFDLESAKIGDRIEHKGFLATTDNPETARRFADFCCYFLINVPVGIPFLYTSYYIDSNANESELLFPAGTILTITRFFVAENDMLGVELDMEPESINNIYKPHALQQK